MHPLSALVITTLAVLFVFHFIDFLAWGTSWAHDRVFPKVPSEMWRRVNKSEEPRIAQRRMMLLGMVVTSFAAVAFVPFVWVLGPYFMGARGVLLAVILWSVFIVPTTLYQSIYFRVPKEMFWLQTWAGLARVIAGFLTVTWLLTLFGIW
jgi:hypothetical protein